MEEDRGKEREQQGKRTKYMRDSAPHGWFFSCGVDMAVYYRGDSPYIVFARISKDVY